MFGRRAAFWLAVAGVATLTPFAINLAANKLPLPGLRRFRDFIYCAPSQG